MPQVPTYNDPEVKQEALPGARLQADAPLEAFGGGASVERVQSAATGLATEAGNIYDRHQALADQMFAQNADAQFKNIKNNLLYNDQDGLQTQKGQNAFGAPETYSQRYKDDTSALMNSATTDRQRAILQNLNQRTQSQFGAAIQKHVYAETQTFDKETTDAGITASINDGVNNYTDKGLVAQSANDISQNIDMWGQRQGYPKDKINVQKQLALSQLYGSVIQRTADNGEDLIAQNLFDQYKGSMTADQINSSEKLLKAASTKGESQRMSDSIMSTTNDEATAMAKVKQIQDPGIRDATEARIKDNFSLKETEKRQRDEATSDRAGKIISNGGSLDDIPRSDWVNMSPGAQKSLTEQYRFKAAGVEPVTNWQKYTDLKEMASNPATRDDFMKTDPMTYYPYLDHGKYTEMVNLRTGMINHDAAAEGKIGDIRTDRKVVQDTLDSLKLTAGKSKNEVKAITATFDQQFTQSANDMSQALKRKLTDAEKQDVASKLAVSVATKPGWFGTSIGDGSKPTFMVNPTDIPPDELPKIDAFLKSRGIPVNDRTRVQQYQLKLGQMNGK